MNHVMLARLLYVNIRDVNEHFFLAPPAGSVYALRAPQGQSRCESNVHSQLSLYTLLCGLSIPLFIIIIASFRYHK